MAAATPQAAGHYLTVPLDLAYGAAGLQAVHAVESCLSGAGVRLAVLDTGFDAAHPDYADRVVQMESFVDGESAQDEHGHGTHCIGSACGSLRTQVLPRYGVAHGAEIYAGKVLSNRGGGADRGILAGMDWALGNRCRVVSMSLGAPTQPDQAFSQVYEAVARRSLRAGTVIVAAAGNDSHRESGTVRPVSHPANCPSIMAVGAVDRNLAVAPFSNSGVNPNGGQVDVAAPGVDVHSSIPGGSYDRWNGTSMATPHVAGVLALLAESDPGATGAELAARVTTTARRLPLASADDLDHLDEVVEGLTSQGLAVTGAQSTLGTVSGRVARSALAGLSAVAGVEAVEQARTFQLPPPDADMQGGPSA